MPRSLVVANQTLGGRPLVDLIERMVEGGGWTFHVVVPATPPKDGWTWTDERARAIARGRLDRALARFAALGIEVGGEIGDANPFLAVGDILRRERFDAILLSTLPAGMSRWLRLDLPRRMEAVFGLPLFHVVCRAVDHAAARSSCTHGVRGARRLRGRHVARPAPNAGWTDCDRQPASSLTGPGGVRERGGTDVSHLRLPEAAR